MSDTRLRHVAEVNPATPEFDRLSDDEPVTFLPLEAVWPGTRLDVSRTRPKREVSSGYTRFREDDVLVPKITPTFEGDRSTIARGLRHSIGAGTTELHIVRPGSSLDVRYANYLMSSRSFLQGGKAAMKGVAGQQRVPDEWLLDFHVPVAGLTRQRAIADFLDAETARIDALIEKKRHLIELFIERVETAIEQYTWQIPRSEQLQLRRAVAQFVDYRGATPAKAEEGVPLVTAAHIANGSINLSREPQFLSRSTYIEWMRRGWPERDDIVMTTEAPLGEVAQIVDTNVALAQRVILLKSEPSSADPTFLAYCLRARSFQDQLKAHATGSTASGIKAERLRALTVPMPSLKVQRTSIKVLKAMEERSLRLRDRLMMQIELLTEHRQALITAAVTGQIEVPETTISSKNRRL